MVINEWGSKVVISRGRIHSPSQIEGLVAELDSSPTGFLSFRIEGSECEIVTLNSFHEAKGIGSALIKEIERVARKHRCERLWLVTTNDNRRAHDFYQKRGFKITAIHKGAIMEYRKLKPEIPQYGIDEIPITDELVLEKYL